MQLEAVYATIAYYWRNQAQMNVYLRAWREHSKQMRQAQELNPPPVVQRLRAIFQQRHLAAQPQAVPA